MSTTVKQLTLEKAAFDQFLASWKRGKFSGLRLGQAFYNEFALHKLSDQFALQGLYEKDGQDALDTIQRVFHLE